MAKRIEIDGRFYRMRRGKLVEIPEEWVGQTLDSQTKRKRLSKGTRKQRNAEPRKTGKEGFRYSGEYLAMKRGETVED